MSEKLAAKVEAGFDPADFRSDYTTQEIEAARKDVAAARKELSFQEAKLLHFGDHDA